ncbi:hypothetical protein, partial [Campylobacter pinnipediorum]|uniref:hypothetical protein n=1 Tax=Campylobacter pinnipediorum TaxID=1965231 RepID=UPI0015D6638D
MKISKIASATIIGVMMTINAYGGSSLDEINNAQKEKSDFIKKLEEVSKEGFLENLKQEQAKKEQEKSDFIKKIEKANEAKTEAKDQAETAKQEKQKAEAARDEAEKLKQQAQKDQEKAEQAKTAAELARDEANKAKTAAELARDEANKAKTAAEELKLQAKKEQKVAEQAKTAAELARNEAQKEKQQAETKAFGDNVKIKALNERIEKDNVLRETFQKLSSNNFKGSEQDLKDAIGVFDKNTYNDNELGKLYQDSAGNQNEQKLEIIEKLYKIGLINEDRFSEFKKLKEQQDTKNKQVLTAWLNEIIGRNNGEGLRRLIGDTRQDAQEIKTELEAIIEAKDKIQKEADKIAEQQKIIEEKQEIEAEQQQIEKQQQQIEKQKEAEIIEKQTEAEAKEKEAKEKQTEIEQQDQKIVEEDQKIKKQKKEIEAKEKEIAQQTEKIAEQEQLEQQAQEKLKELEQAEKELKQAEELAKAAKDPEAKAKVLAELESKIEEAKKDRAKSISKDESLKFDNNEAQTVLSLLSVTNNEEVNNLLLKTEASDIATLAKNINSTLEEVSKEFKDNKTVDTLLSSVGSATNSRLAKLSNPLNDDLALAYAIKNLSDNKFADNADTLSSVVKE